jgi:tRNA(fMet)-specific endonuclease VapC
VSYTLGVQFEWDPDKAEANVKRHRVDTLMAAHALSLGLTFVTNNTQHFSRVVGLRTANWV